MTRPCAGMVGTAKLEGVNCMNRLLCLAALGFVTVGSAGCNTSNAPPLPKLEKSAEPAGATTDSSASVTPSNSSANPAPRDRSAPPAVATEPMAGYVLIAPLRSTETYLLNADKQVVHRWKSKYSPAASVYLLPNGHVLRPRTILTLSTFTEAVSAGLVERFNWDGELVWSYRYADEHHCAGSNIAMLPSGNLLMVGWERKSKEEAIAQGRDPKLLKDDLWPDHVIEVQPEGSDGGKIVWEWHMWDHLIQDFDREKPNYGVVYDIQN